MLQPYIMKSSRFAILLLIALTVGATAFSQISISPNPGCAVQGTDYQYTISGNWNPSATSATMTWTVTGGTIVSHTNPLTGFFPSIHVIWNAGASSGQISLSYTNGSTQNASITTNLVTTLTAGTIVPVSQTINYNTTPASLTMGAATGGACSPNYTYQWQQSSDGVNFTNISGATAVTLNFTAALTNTTYYRNLVTETSTGNTVYSSVVTITVNGQLTGGTINGPTGTVLSYSTSPGLLTSTASASGGSCAPNFNYQWQYSIDGTNYTDIAGANNATFIAPALVTPTYFCRKVTCTSSLPETAYSNALYFQVGANITAGTIFPGQITIPTGTSPGLLTANAAQGGNCSGNYQYQWQGCTDNVSWTNINGATSLTYNPGTLSATTYYRIKITCGTDVVYTSTAIITIGSTSAVVPGNYIRTRTFLKPAVTDMTAAAALTSPFDVSQVTQYYDGLGKPLQTVGKQQTPLQKDMVSLNVYDNFGREINQLLPYPSSSNDGNYKTTAFADQNSFNTAQFPGEQYYYSQVQVEASALGRVQLSMPAGMSWVGSSRGGTTQYLVNSAAEGVKIWNIASAAGSLPTTNAVYGDGQLIKTISTDESNHQVIEYKDKEGQVVLKKVQQSNTPGIDHTGWLCTYYVYDDLGHLRFVLQPKAVELYLTGTAIASLSDELCFRYEYDKRGRTVIKKVPGAGEVQMVYDQRDRAVFNQDANMRSGNQWMASLYDDQNRPVMTGMMTYTGTQGQLQTYVDQNTGNYVNTTLNNTNTPASDQYYNIRQNGVTLYAAQSSVTFTDGFTSESTAEFVVQSGNANSSTESVSVSDNPVPATATLIPLTLTYYDNYNWTGKSFNPSYNTYLDAGSNLYAEPSTSSTDVSRVNIHGMSTGSKVRVIEDPNNLAAGVFLSTVSFYDIKGRVAQTQSDNYKGGNDIATLQYDFSGKTLSSFLVHNNPTAAQQMGILTKTAFDHGGRVLSIAKSVYNKAADGSLSTAEVHPIVNNTYNELGQLTRKILAPSYNNGAGLETLNYDYNIRGWLLGVNRDYARDANNTNYFGFDLGYDKQNNNLIGGQQYTNAQFNGNITGMVWKSRGDGEKRKYDFTYDNLNRLTGADFNQYSSGAFNKTAGIDFSVSNLSYDANGNILAMNQKGWKLGGSALIDQLAYSYQSNSNKLLQVTDAYNDNNSTLGDFKYDAATKTSQDYSYDVNGNLITDNNKKIGSIGYNHLNLPQIINVGTKGGITYIYDAAGNKLEKRVNENASAANNNTAKNTVTDYIGGFVYENNVLQFVGHEEGRFRYLHTSAPSCTGPTICGHDQLGRPIYCPCDPVIIESFIYNYDYMLKDHLGNVRMVLTEEQQQDKYPVASMEPSKLATEQQYYSIDNSKIVAANTVTGLPAYTNDNGIGNNPSDASFETANSTKLYKLNSGSNKTGLGMTLKVMAGDKIDIFGKSYYFQNNTGGTSVNSAVPVLDILNGLVGSPSGVIGATGHQGVTGTQLSGIPAVTDLVNSLLSDETNDIAGTPTTPKAYINYLFFNEQFKCVGKGFSRVGSNSVLKDHHSELQNISAPQNGYVYIYVSDESPTDVFFDNLQVVHTRGPILEETHYYPFGLTMAGISSKALKSNYVENKKHKFQNQEYNDDLGVDVYEFKYRMDDPQTGRFWQIDPLSDKYVYNSTYAFSENKVTSHIELEGLETVPTTGARGADGKYPVQGDANGNGVVDKSERESWSGANLGWIHVGTHIPLIFVPEVGVPLVLTEITGVPMIPSPQAMASEAPVVAENTANQISEEASAAKGVDLVIKGKANWNASQNAQAANKAKILTEEPNTFVTKNPVKRDANLRSKFVKAGGSVGPKEHVDHKVDLQLGGTDNMTNLAGLDGSVNTSFGKQIQLQIKNLPDATRVNQVNFIPHVKGTL